MMLIDGFEITRFSEEDGLPIKNRLPAELEERMKTEKQWLLEGLIPKAGAEGHEMHAAVMYKQVCRYYLDTEVEPINSGNAPKNCMGCAIREGKYCIVAGDYVSSKNCCSEWVPITP